MEINEARQIQKILFAHSSCSYKRMRTILSREGKLCYTVIHHIDDKLIPLYMYNDRIKALIENGIDIEIRYIDDIPHVPKGLYIGEIIPID